MKTLIVSLLAVLSIANQSFAEYCQGNLCVGDWVIDTDNYIGQVTGFPDDVTARYKVGSSSYDEKIARLQKEVKEINDISPGKKVIDSDNYVGVAKRAFADGRVYYTVGSSNYVSSALSPEIAEYNFIKAGTNIIDTDNYVGVAEAVFKDKRVLYRVGSSRYVSNKLVAETNSINNLSANVLVIDSDNYIGKVVRVFRDSRILYQVGSSLYISTKLSPEVSSKGLLSKGTVVIDADNYIGTVSNIFADGRIYYKVGSSNYVATNLKAKIDEYKSIRTNDVVIDADNYIGTVSYVFEDGRYYYKVGSSNYVTKTLSKEVSEVDGFKKGMVIVDSDDYVGTIARVFEDGRTNYKVSSSSYVTHSKNISKEVDTHPVYTKNTIYAGNGYVAGKAIRFFENKKVQLEGLNGGTLVQEVLFTQVNNLDQYKPEMVAQDSKMRDIVIKMVFENGAVAYELKSPEKGEENKIYGGKIYSFFIEKDAKGLELLKTEEQKYWILQIAEVVAKNENISYWPNHSPYISVIDVSQLPELKKTLAERLFEEPEMIENKTLRKKVREYLTH